VEAPKSPKSPKLSISTSSDSAAEPSQLSPEAKAREQVLIL